MSKDPFCAYYQEYLHGVYDCVDRIVLLAYNSLLQGPGGFRHWWRILSGDDTTLDTTHVMRFAGRFSRRIRTFAEKHSIPFHHCGRNDRKHEIAEKYIPKDPAFQGVFCILSARAPAPVYEVQRYGTCGINLVKKHSYVYQYSFHIIDSQWGHVTIKLSPHPPFNAMIMLNGHEYVERQMRKKRIAFTKKDNCFTAIPDAAGLAGVADTMISRNRDVGRLVNLCERWIYSACLCFALDTQEQERTQFRYSYSVFQAEYSRNLLFERPAMVDTVFQQLIDRNRTALDIGTVKTIIGKKRRPHHKHSTFGKPPRVEVVVEKPAYDLTIFKLHCGKLTVKMYSKGEHVLRIEAIAHNTSALQCGRGIERFPAIVAELRAILQRFMECVHCVDVSFISASTLERWHLPTYRDNRRIAGININNRRMRTVMEGLLAIAARPASLTTAQLAAFVRRKLGYSTQKYATRHAAYDLTKFRAKGIVVSSGKRNYRVTKKGMKNIAAYITLQDKVITPVLRRIESKNTRKPYVIHNDSIDTCYRKLQANMWTLFNELRIAA